VINNEYDLGVEARVLACSTRNVPGMCRKEAARHAAVVKNMHRLRALRLQQDEKAKVDQVTSKRVARDKRA
jgi:hypothetical protein